MPQFSFVFNLTREDIYMLESDLLLNNVIWTLLVQTHVLNGFRMNSEWIHLLITYPERKTILINILQTPCLLFKSLMLINASKTHVFHPPGDIFFPLRFRLPLTGVSINTVCDTPVAEKSIQWGFFSLFLFFPESTVINFSFVCCVHSASFFLKPLSPFTSITCSLIAYRLAWLIIIILVRTLR